MGRKKAAIRWPDRSGPDAQTLSVRTAGMLLEVCSLALEVGPGDSGLESVLESPPGAGPLTAVAAGWRALTARGWEGPVLVLATDLPRLNVAMLRWLDGHPAPGSVVPVVDGRVQPLCARYSPADLAAAAQLAESGRRAMRDLVESFDGLLVQPEEWAAVAGPDVLADVDTPEDLMRMTGGSAPPSSSANAPTGPRP
jgi:molybdopterin-guanine dinucleotide biosynthesis protein A